MKVELEGMQAQIEEQKQQSLKSIHKLAVKEKQTATLKASLERKDSNLAAQIASIQAEKTTGCKTSSSTSNTLNEAASQVQNTTSNNNHHNQSIR